MNSTCDSKHQLGAEHSCIIRPRQAPRQKTRNKTGRRPDPHLKHDHCFRVNSHRDPVVPSSADAIQTLERSVSSSHHCSSIKNVKFNHMEDVTDHRGGGGRSQPSPLPAESSSEFNKERESPRLTHWLSLPQKPKCFPTLKTTIYNSIEQL